jgi:hypothetical protein
MPDHALIVGIENYLPAVAKGLDRLCGGRCLRHIQRNQAAGWDPAPASGGRYYLGLCDVKDIV